MFQLMPHDTQHMQCLEVWGGNQAVDSGVVMLGLDAWAFSKPWAGDAAGGDVHYVSSCASGRITRMLVADVAGHGTKVAETASRLRNLMRRFVNHLDQRKFVAELNSEFAQLSQDGRFATAVVCTFFAPTNHLTISNAGHPPPLHYQAKTRTWQIVTPQQVETPKRRNAKTQKAIDAEIADKAKSAGEGPANLPLGIVDAPRYDSLPLRLDVGDIVMCYSDALIECHGRDGRMLGAAGLLEIVRNIDVTNPSAFTASVLKTIEALAPGNLSGDDITVLLFRPNGLAPRLSIRARFATHAHMLGALWRTIRHGEPFPMPDLSLPNIGGVFLNRLGRVWRGK